MNYGKYVGIVIFFSVMLVGFTSAVVIFVPSVRLTVENFLVAYNDPSSTQIQTRSLAADVVMANINTGSIGTSTSQTPSSVSADTSWYDSTAVTPKVYEYKLLRSVDICQLNALGAQGFDAVQFGGNIDTSSGRNGDCKTVHTVDVLDWVLFSREK